MPVQEIADDRDNRAGKTGVHAAPVPEELRRLCDLFPTAAVLHSATGANYLNPRAREFFGIPEGAAPPEGTLLSRVHPQDLQGLAAMMRSASAGADAAATVRFVDSGNRTLEADLRMRGVEAEGQRYLVTFAFDVSEREEAKRRLSRLERLRAVRDLASEAILVTSDFRVLCEEICRLIVHEGAFRDGVVRIAEDGVLVPIAGAGSPDRNRTPRDLLAGQERPSVRALLENRIVVCNDTAKDPEFSSIRDEALANRDASIGYFPLHADGGAVGTLSFYAEDVGAFDDEVVRACVEIARKLSLAFGRIRTEARLGAVTRLRNLLSRVNEAIFRTPEKRALSAEVCRLVVETGGFMRGVIRLVEDGRLVPFAGDRRGSMTDTGRNMARQSSRPSVRAVLEDRIIIGNDTAADTVFDEVRAEARRHGIRSVGYFPIHESGKAVGLLSLYAAEPGLFEDDIVALCTDIARNISFAFAKHRADADRAELEARYRMLFDAAPDGTCVLVDGRLAMVNQAVVTLLRAGSADQLLGREVGSFAHPDEAHLMFRRPIPSAAGDNPQHVVRHRARRLDGSYAVVESLATAFDLEGRRAVLVALRDVSERVAAERRVARLTALNAALSRTNRAIFSIRDEARLSTEVCSIAVEEGGLLAATIRMVDGTAGTDDIPAIAGAGIGAPDLSALKVAPDHPHNVVSRAVREKCPVVINDVSGAPESILDHALVARLGIRAAAAFPMIIDDRAIGALTLNTGEAGVFDAEYCAVAQEMAGNLAMAFARGRLERERARAEDELRRLNAELEERVRHRTAELEHANRELGEFSYIVSHDLKAPLRGIASLVEWLEKDHGARLDRDGLELIRLLSVRSRRMHRLVEDVLQYSRVGRARETALEHDLGPLVRDVIDSLHLPPAIEARVEGRLPTLRGDETRLRQVFQNLIGNAAKFNDKPRGHVVVSASREDGFWRIAVSDDGPGIAPRHHERIFEVFQTLGPRDRDDSTGIGLAIVKKIVEAQGGRVGVDSTPGVGSTFTFTWPAHGDADEESRDT